MKAFGIRFTMRILGIVALFTAGIYFLLNVFYIRPRSAAKQKEAEADVPAKSKPADQQVENGIVNPVYTADEPNGKAWDVFRMTTF